MPFPFPAADDVEAFVELGEQVDDFGRVVLQVAIDRDDALAVGRVKAGAQCGGLAEIAPQANAQNSRIARPPVRLITGQVPSFEPSSTMIVCRS